MRRSVLRIQLDAFFVCSDCLRPFLLFLQRLAFGVLRRRCLHVQLRAVTTANAASADAVATSIPVAALGAAPSLVGTAKTSFSANITVP